MESGNLFGDEPGYKPGLFKDLEKPTNPPPKLEDKIKKAKRHLAGETRTEESE